MKTSASTVAEFQRRRNATRHAIRGWLVLCVVCVILLCVLPFTKISAQTDPHLLVGLVLVLMVIASLIAVNIEVRRIYRCPTCNMVPIQTHFGWTDELGMETRDVEWNPSECPNCHASLR